MQGHRTSDVKDAIALDDAAKQKAALVDDAKARAVSLCPAGVAAESLSGVAAGSMS
jgi:hypothetical protein